jgi:hypothetical protein
VNVAVVGNFVPDISTEVALRHVNLLPPVHSKLHGRRLSRFAPHPLACGIVILTVITLSSA